MCSIIGSREQFSPFIMESGPRMSHIWKFPRQCQPLNPLCWWLSHAIGLHLLVWFWRFDGDGCTPFCVGSTDLFFPQSNAYLPLSHCSQISVQFSCSVMSDSLRPHEPRHARPPCPSPTPGVHPNPCPLSRGYHPTISSFVVPFSSRLQSFPALGSFPVSHLSL